ncbi:hypothetical protein D1BOALGB6SA_4652 [Olavius sp. associated proteobacterium Delta 1]|nr:hypothetical protein D1BOALGB6SA_4652 [Olavius sp. associated proteobacterium Delta 1]
MIASEIGCCLRSLGIVLNERLCTPVSIQHPSPALPQYSVYI